MTIDLIVKTEKVPYYSERERERDAIKKNYKNRVFKKIKDSDMDTFQL